MRLVTVSYRVGTSDEKVYTAAVCVEAAIILFAGLCARDDVRDARIHWERS